MAPAIIGVTTRIADAGRATWTSAQPELLNQARFVAFAARAPIDRAKGSSSGYLNWKLVRSWPKVGLKTIFSRSISLETKVATVKVP